MSPPSLPIPDGPLDVETDVSHLSDEEKGTRLQLYLQWYRKGGRLTTAAGTELLFDLENEGNVKVSNIKWKVNGEISVAKEACQICKEINTLRPKKSPPFVCLVRADQSDTRVDGITPCAFCQCGGSSNVCKARPCKNNQDDENITKSDTVFDAHSLSTDDVMNENNYTGKEIDMNDDQIEQKEIITLQISPKEKRKRIPVNRDMPKLISEKCIDVSTSSEKSSITSHSPLLKAPIGSTRKEKLDSRLTLLSLKALDEIQSLQSLGNGQSEEDSDGILTTLFNDGKSEEEESSVQEESQENSALKITEDNSRFVVDCKMWTEMVEKFSMVKKDLNRLEKEHEELKRKFDSINKATQKTSKKAKILSKGS